MFEHYIFGEFIKSNQPLTGADIDHLTGEAGRVSGKIQEVATEKIIELLDQVSHLWLEEDFKLRKTALLRMPRIVGYSREMAELALDSLFSKMKRESLIRIIRGNIGRATYLDRFEYVPPFDGYLKAQPLGTLLHVSPGNVFVGGVDSLIYGFLSKNVNILKLSRQDSLFPLLFAQSLKMVDENKILCNSLAVINFDRDNKEIETRLKHNCNGIVVYGGEEAVRSYRQDLPMGVKLVEYGPKYSFSIITKEGFLESREEELMAACAMDVTIWEQRACSSPQVIYVQKDIYKDFLEKLPIYLENISKKYPQFHLTMDEKVEKLKALEMARFEEAQGKVILQKPPRSGRWAVIGEQDPALKTSPLNRTVYVKPFTSWADILSQAVNLRDYLQTVAIKATVSEMKALTKALARLGVSRITIPGKMGIEKAGSPHDFGFPLRKLINWVTIDWIEKRIDLGEKIAPAKLEKTRWNRLRNLIRFARSNSDFYKEHYSDVDLTTINNYQAFTRVPLLTKNHIYNNSPPVSEKILTGSLRKAYVFASGGSTGEPKFNFYSYRELDEVSSILADIYQIAGVNRDDVVANLFMAGSLWTSFIVVNHALEKIGCVSLPIAGNVELDMIIHYVELFKPTTIVGLPSMIVQLAERIKNRGINITIEKILYGGEHFSAEAVSFLREILGTRLIHSAGYASVDAGPIGYQCQENIGGVHHQLYEYMFLEILDRQTGEPVADGEVGEIAVTNLNRRLMPIIRYRTGDLGRKLNRGCKCMHGTPLFELMGRCDDALRISGMNVFPRMVLEAITHERKLTPIIQLIASSRNAKDLLTIKIEAGESEADYNELAREARHIILAHNPELDLCEAEDWMFLEVEVVPPGALGKSSRTGKIKAVIDERKKLSE